MSEYAIYTDQLRKEFGKKIAVEGLSLHVNRGEVFGFLGPNGAGKTTSIKMLLGLVHRTSGDGTILGQPIGSRAVRSKVGYLPEHFRFYPWLKATEFLNLHGRLYGVSAADRRQRIPELLTRVGLGKEGDNKLGGFSKGMTQRIGLAQALMNNPELVILDEPTSGLDPMGRRLVRDVISELRDQGTTVFVNSHLLSEIEKTCDRVAFIRQGNVVRTYELASLQSEEVRVKMRVGGDKLSYLPHIETIGKNLEETNTGHVLFNVEDEKTVADLVDWLVGRGLPVYEMTPERLSLEERFVRVMNGTGEEA